MRKTVMVLLMLALILGLGSGCGAEMAGLDDWDQIGLITPAGDSWQKQTLTEGAEKAAAELGAAIVLLSPDADGTLPAEQLRKMQALIIYGEETADLSEVLPEAGGTEMPVVAVDSSLKTEHVFSADHYAAGKAAGEALLAALETKRIPSGTIGLITPNAEEEQALQQEAGFRSVFEESDYTLLETRYSRNNDTMSRSIAWDLLKRGTVGIFASGTETLLGAGNAAKDADSRAVIVGCGRVDSVRHLLEDGTVRAVAAPDYTALGYESVKTVVSMLKEEGAGSAAPAGGVTVVESKVPVLTNQDFRIALIAADPMDPTWTQRKEGARTAAEELGCHLQDLSPAYRNEKEQIRQMEQAAEDGFHAIVTSVGDSEDMHKAVQKAMETGIRVICMDAPEGLEVDGAFVVDHRAAGKAAAEIMLEDLKAWDVQEGAIGIIGVDEETEAALQREEGFRSVFEGTSFALWDTQYSAGDAAKAHAIAEGYFWKKAKGIFCCDEASTVGAGNAMEARQANMAVVGFGISETVEELVKKGALRASVAEDPKTMGYEAIKAACKILREEIPAGSQLDVEFLTLRED